MCLAVLDYQPDRTVLLAHRDEYYQRPTLPLHVWPNGIAAGKDLEAGGTWLGVAPNGRWAILTNIPTPEEIARVLAPGDNQALPPAPKVARSRGLLVLDYLTGRWDTPPEGRYAGFNLLLGRPGRVDYFSSHAPHQTLKPGLYTLANAPLNHPETRTSRARELYSLQLTALEELKIDLGHYGTRSTTLLIIEKDAPIRVEELSYPSLDHRSVQIELDHDFLAN